MSVTGRGPAFLKPGVRSILDEPGMQPFGFGRDPTGLDGTCQRPDLLPPPVR